jgi:leucyl aminopeptidase (aminopeptidase T)
MQKMNAVMAVTSRSISHTNARRDACRMGTRIVSMPNITSPTFTRLAATDFKKVARLSKKMSDILTIGKDVRVTAPNGTDLEISIEKGRGYADTGALNFPGAFSNLPAGEACILPDSGKTDGVLIVDSGMGGNKKDDDRLVLAIRNGRVTRISGSLAAEKLRRQLAKYGGESRIVAEFGIGTNRNALISGYSLEDEKVLGTIHIAVGNNVSFGGDIKVPIHLDGVVYKASVEIDGRKILQRGRLLLD